jgi:hypothetical protein
MDSYENLYQAVEMRTLYGKSSDTTSFVMVHVLFIPQNTYMTCTIFEHIATMEHKRAATSAAEDAALHVKKTPSNDSSTAIVTHLSRITFEHITTMEHKRAATSAAEDAAFHVKKTPSNDSGTVMVTPERAKKPRHDEGGGSESNRRWPRPQETRTRGTEKQEQVSEEADKEQDSVGDNDDHNEDGDAPAVVDGANKPLKAATIALVTADSVMGFPKYPLATNRELMTQHIEFVNWAKKMKKQGSVYGRLKDFLEWVESPEGKGFEKLTFGQHIGQTFAEVALNDPGYHIRYMHMLRKKGESPSDKLAAYISWFKETRGTSSALNKTPRISNKSTSTISGNEQFTFGQHKGQTFHMVAINDPSYHRRYMSMNESLHPEMDRYIEYFHLCGDQQAAHEGEMDAIAYHAEIYRPCWHSAQYD